ncbi:unnamed protein product [Withania somnifera]
MFPRSNIIHDPFSYTSQELLKQYYNTHDYNHQNPNSTSTVVEEEKDHPLFLNFPSPFFDDFELPLSQIFSQNHHQEYLEASDNHETDQVDPNNALKDNHSADNSRSGQVNTKIMGDQSSNSAISRKPAESTTSSSKKRNLSAKPRKRTGKKDRHSKICTAQGVRDRRIRLSIQIARKFFDLQDILGFDKASKTIEWLFSKSKNAIKELSRDHFPQENNSSDQNILDDHRKLRKIESRDRPTIREKAREKTKLGHNKKGNQEMDETNPKSIDKLGSNSHSLEHQFDNVGIMERYLGGASLIKGGIDISGNCFDMGFLENCTITNEVSNPICKQ